MKMSDDRKPASPVPPAPQVLQSPNFRTIYANGFSYRASVADFGITALTQIPVTHQTPDGNVFSGNVNLQEVMIMLSLPGVKALTENLVLLVKEIEKEVGHIKVPKGARIDTAQLQIISESLKLTPLED